MEGRWFLCMVETPEFQAFSKEKLKSQPDTSSQMYSLWDSHRKSSEDGQISMAAKPGTVRRLQQILAMSLPICKLMQTFPALPKTLTGGKDWVLVSGVIWVVALVKQRGLKRGWRQPQVQAEHWCPGALSLSPQAERRSSSVTHVVLLISQVHRHTGGKGPREVSTPSPLLKVVLSTTPDRVACGFV